jgi:hypothetical protein
MCGQVLSNYFCVSFVQFGEKLKHKTPRKGGHLSNLSREEDEQSTPKRRSFGKVHFSLFIFYFSQLHP